MAPVFLALEREPEDLGRALGRRRVLRHREPEELVALAVVGLARDVEPDVPPRFGAELSGDERLEPDRLEGRGDPVHEEAGAEQHEAGKR